MRRIGGQVRNYPWGTKHAIASLLGAEATSEPWAEYWLGTHPMGASKLLDDEEHTLSDLISGQPALLGDASVAQFGPQLPYLLKLLSADQPLSLQAHPSREQAEEGFAREQAAQVPFDSPQRTFKDTWPKPEILVALTPFSALAGFRNPAESAALFAELDVKSSLESIIGPLTKRSSPAGLAEVFLDVLSLEPARRHLVDEVVAAAVPLMGAQGLIGEFARTAVELDEHFPSDPGILAALLMNRVELMPRQALFMPAGYMHAYLRGTGVELMGNSDNVLRGGLTKKHIDVDGLISVVEFQESKLEVLTPQGADGTYSYDTGAPEFKLWLLEPCDKKQMPLPGTGGARIALVTHGGFVLYGAEGDTALAKGQAVFIGADEEVCLSGDGQLFLAAPGVG